jgi:Asp-tRNA(Asn)/Glu-tRNA(Gln) amidotransferase A subunit family amidase
MLEGLCWNLSNRVMQGILEGEKAGEAILWLSHAGVTTRSVEDTGNPAECFGRATQRSDGSRLSQGCIGVAEALATRFNSDKEVIAAFKTAVEVVHALGHEIVTASAPFDTPSFGDVHVY